MPTVIHKNLLKLLLYSHARAQFINMISTNLQQLFIRALPVCWTAQQFNTASAFKNLLEYKLVSKISYSI
jgi:hypothetical protein